MYLYCFVLSMVVEIMGEVEMVWMFASERCALGHCVDSGGVCDEVVVRNVVPVSLLSTQQVVSCFRHILFQSRRSAYQELAVSIWRQYLSIILLVKGKIIADFSQWGDPLFALLPDAPASCFLLWLGFKI